MPKHVIDLAHRPLLEDAVADALTHKKMTSYERRYGLDTEVGGATKTDRAQLLVSHILSSDDPGRHLLDLLDFAFIMNNRRDWNGSPDPYPLLDKKVLRPCGIVRTAGGFRFAAGKGAQETPEAPLPVAATPAPHFSGTATSPAPHVTSVPSGAQGRQVFVVHGQDKRPVTVLRQFLSYIGLQMMSWSDASEATGKSLPTTFDIVTAGMKHAAAIIVIFSPDEEARLSAAFTSDREPGPVGRQPRQNVILEAGMAFAMAPHKTIFVRSGEVRQISDIDGFNWVPMNGAFDSRVDLKKRLQRAGASVHSGELDLMDRQAGPFCVEE